MIKPCASLFAASAFFGSIFSVLAQTKTETPAHSQATGFIEGSSLTGKLYYWQRKRSNRNIADNGRYKTNLSHSTSNISLNFQSGYVAGIAGVDIGVYTAIEIAEGANSNHPNEIAFSTSRRASEENWSGSRTGISFYQAAAKFKYGPVWLRTGYIQPVGQGLLTSSGDLVPGIYQGAETGADLDFGTAGISNISYIITNKYKAPWYTELDSFYQNDRNTKIDFLQSIGIKHDFKNDLIMEIAYGHAQGYMDRYFAGIGYKFDIADQPLSTRYQFYGAHDRVPKDTITPPHTNDDPYDGLAWLQALMLDYKTGPFIFKLEGKWIKAKGNRGFFLQRMTPTYASSESRLDIGWDSSSDFNAHGEKAIFLGIMYDLGNRQLPGWTVGASYAYGWDARPSSFKDFNQNQRLQESAFNLDILYTVQHGQMKGMQFKLHFTQYNNHSNIPSFSNGYRNIFQDERNVKFLITAPFTLFPVKSASAAKTGRKS